MKFYCFIAAKIDKYIQADIQEVEEEGVREDEEEYESNENQMIIHIHIYGGSYIY